MAGDPADIRRAPVDVAVVVVEHVLVRHRRVDEIAAGGVQHALRGAGRAGGVEDEERVLGVHLLDGALVGHLGGGLVVIDVAARHHVDRGAGAAHHEHVVDAADPLDRRVDIRLEGHLAAAAQALVGGDHEGRLRVLDAAGEGIRREAAEHHRVDGAEPRAGEHRVGGLRDHRQVDRHPVALLDAAVAHDVRHAAHLGVQLAIRDGLRLGRVVPLPDDRRLVAAGGEVAVDAVVGGVGGAVLVPADRHLARPEAGVLDPGERAEPVDAPALLGPEGLRVLDRVPVLRLVSGGVEIGPAAPIRRNVVDLVLHGVLPEAPPPSAAGVVLPQGLRNGSRPPQAGQGRTFAPLGRRGRAAPAAQRAKRPRTAPWSSRTASQCPPSITVSIDRWPPKPWLVDSVVITKPSQTRNPATIPPATPA